MNEGNVLCAIDVNDFDQNVVDVAARFASQFGVDLELIHVTLVPDPMKAAWPAYTGDSNEIAKDNQRLREIGTTIPGVEIHRHQLSGMPVEKLVAFTNRNQPQLLVLGTHARRGIKRMLGSVAMKIMRRVECPVVVLRQRKNSQDFSDMKAETI